MQSAIREVIGATSMDRVLTDGRAEIVTQVRDRMQELLNSYHTGLKVQSVNLQDVQPPEAVQPAFEDAIRAREDEQRYISEASAHANKIIPQARGEAAQIEEQAKGYESKVTNAALGEASRFTQLLQSYRLAPDLTRERMYLDTMSEVLSKNRSVVLDTPGNGNNVFYLPLGQTDTKPAMTKSAFDPASLPLPTPSVAPATDAASRGSVASDNRSDLRSRSAP